VASLDRLRPLWQPAIWCSILSLYFLLLANKRWVSWVLSFLHHYQTWHTMHYLPVGRYTVKRRTRGHLRVEQMSKIWWKNIHAFGISEKWRSVVAFYYDAPCRLVNVRCRSRGDLISLVRIFFSLATCTILPIVLAIKSYQIVVSDHPEFRIKVCALLA